MPQETRPEPNFIIIGAPRAGTTWLAENLTGHPQIFLTSEKELHFFDRHYSEGYDHYLSYFKDASGAIAIGEATPAYSFKPEVAALIHHHLPNVKLIYIVRNPIERVYSRYWNSKSKFEKNRDKTFEEKLDEKSEFLEEGLYIDHIQRFLKHFPKEQLLILFFDELRDRPEAFLREVYRFLGVDDSYVAPALNVKINSASSKKFVGKSRWIYYASRVFGKLGIHKVRHMLIRLNKKEYPTMKPETHARLLDVYEESIAQLEQLTGRDLSEWRTIPTIR